MRATILNAPKKSPALEKKVKDLKWYIKEVCKGMEVFSFDDQKKADEFGHFFRALEPEAKVEIAALTVRIRV